MQILEKCSFKINHSEIFVKDFSVNKFKEKFPKFTKLIDEMKSNLPDGYKYYLIDFVVHDCKPGVHTCKDVRYHVDGDFEKDNQYVLWVSGPNRTVFPTSTPKILNFPTNRNEQNDYLEVLLKDQDSFEVPEETFVAYTSQTPHKGVICKNIGKRYFFRMMASNYIKPKNHIGK